MKTANFFQQRCRPIQLLRRLAQLRRILRIRCIPRPIIQRVLSIPLFVEPLRKAGWREHAGLLGGVCTESGGCGEVARGGEEVEWDGTAVERSWQFSWPRKG